MNQLPSTLFPDASRSYALAQLNSFAASMGHLYSTTRNFDFGPTQRTNVSLLSPYIGMRLIQEVEVVQTALAHHSYQAAEKFIQEVFWRTYWKGWLELRPAVWNEFTQDVLALHKDGNYPKAYEQACRGNTPIECFNAWVNELITTGYLHNHARMWFASIWIFTLGLPWQLGAEFFYRHLLDGDTACNTLSWRWVAGLHTRGKNYLATADNIKKYTQGKFSPTGLAASDSALPLDTLNFKTYPKEADKSFISDIEPPNNQPLTLLLHEEDLSPEFSPLKDYPINSILALSPCVLQNLVDRASPVLKFKAQAMQDAVQRVQSHFNATVQTIEDVSELSRVIDGSPSRLVMLKPHRGFLRQLVEEVIHLSPVSNNKVYYATRQWDRFLHPKATGGFFTFKKSIPSMISRLDSH